MSIALTPQGGGTPVALYTAPNPAPYINLLQLDQLGEILGNASIQPGAHTASCTPREESEERIPAECIS